MRVTITELAVKAATPGFLRDDRLIGFALRTTKNRSKSFVVEGRVAGRVRRFTIGAAGRFTAAEAREKARKLLVEMSLGRDPQKRRRADRDRSASLRDQLAEYITAKRVKKSTAEKYRRLCERNVAEWIDRPITDITPQMVRLRYEAVVRRSVSEANGTMRVLRAVFRRAAVILPDRADGSPALRVIPTNALAGQWKSLPRRSRVLDASEVAAWWIAVQSLRSDASRRALVTLLLTGLRVSEVLRLQWRDVDELGHQLRIGDSKTGSFVKTIGPELAAMLAGERPAAGGTVFAVRDLRAALDSVAKRGGKAITPHDLRRTFASFAERAGVPHTALKVLLNHALGGDVTIGYVRPSGDDLRHWASQVERAVLAAAAGGTVIPMRRTA